jgi:hypothetical protein
MNDSKLSWELVSIHILIQQKFPSMTIVDFRTN